MTTSPTDPTRADARGPRRRRRGAGIRRAAGPPRDRPLARRAAARARGDHRGARVLVGGFFPDPPPLRRWPRCSRCWCGSCSRPGRSRAPRSPPSWRSRPSPASRRGRSRRASGPTRLPARSWSTTARCSTARCWRSSCRWGAPRGGRGRSSPRPRWAAPSSGSPRSARGCCPRRSRSHAEFGRGRLNWPTSYWNATGLIAALGVVLCAHLASSVRDHPALRVLGAAAVPPLVAAVVFSGSRGAVAAGLIAAVVYLVLGRSRGMLTGLPVPSSAARSRRARAAGIEGLDAVVPIGRGARHRPRDGGVLAVLAGAAAAARGLLLLVDARLERWRAPRMAPVAARGALGAALVVVLVVAGLAAGGVGPCARWVGRLRLERGRRDHRPARPAADGARQQRAHRDLERRAAGRLRRSEPCRAPARARTRCCGSATGPRTATCSTGTPLYLETLGEMGVVGSGAAAASRWSRCSARCGGGRCATERRPGRRSPPSRPRGRSTPASTGTGRCRPSPRGCSARAASRWREPASGMARRAAPGPIGRPLGILARGRVPRARARAAVDPALTGAVDRGAALLPCGRLHADDRPLARVELGVERAAGAAGAHRRGATCASGATRWPSTRPRQRCGATRELGAALHAGARAGRRGPGPAAGGPRGARRNPLHPCAGRGEAVHACKQPSPVAALALEAKLPLGGGP